VGAGRVIKLEERLLNGLMKWRGKWGGRSEKIYEGKHLRGRKCRVSGQVMKGVYE